MDDAEDEPLVLIVNDDERGPSNVDKPDARRNGDVRSDMAERSTLLDRREDGEEISLNCACNMRSIAPTSADDRSELGNFGLRQIAKVHQLPIAER